MIAKVLPVGKYTYIKRVFRTGTCALFKQLTANISYLSLVEIIAFYCFRGSVTLFTTCNTAALA